MHAVKKNTESLAVVSKGIGLEVNADKTKYIVIPGDQNAGRSYSIKTDNSSLKGWNSSNIWEQSYGIKSLFRKK